MRQNYTEYIIRIHKGQKSFPEDIFMKWLKIALGDKVEGRKITVKKHKKLGEKRLIEIIEKEGFCCIKSDRVRGTEVLAKAIIKAQDGKEMISDKLINAIREHCSPEDFDLTVKDDKCLLKFLEQFADNQDA